MVELHLVTYSFFFMISLASAQYEAWYKAAKIKAGEKSRKETSLKLMGEFT